MRHVISYVALVVVGSVLLTAPARAGVLYWDSNPATSDIESTTSGYWTGTYWKTIVDATSGTTWTPGDDAHFTGTSGSTITLDSSVNANKLVFSTAGYTLTGSAITIGSGGITADSSGTISSTIQLSGSQHWSVASGSTLTLAQTETRLTGNYTLDIDGAGVIAAKKYLYIMDSLAVVQSAGTVSCGWNAIGAASTASYTVNGGQFGKSGQTLFVGYDKGVGTLTVNNGGLAKFANLNVASGSLSTVYVNNGGSLSIYSVNIGSGKYVVNFDGGMLDFYSGGTKLGNFTIQDGGMTIRVAGGDAVLSGALLGDSTSTGGRLTKLGSFALTLNGANTYTGDTTIKAGKLTLASTGSMLMDINASGNNTKFIGEGGSLVLDGVLKLDVVDAGTEGTWDLIDSDLINANTYGSSFSLLLNGETTAFTETSAGIWTHVQGAATWAFTEATGTLSVVVPEPSTLALLISSLLGLAAYAWRKRK